MSSSHVSIRAVLLVLFALAVAGCSSPKTNTVATNGGEEGSTETGEGDQVDAQTTETNDEKIEFKLGDMVEPFTPPALDELDKIANWQDRPVRDSLALLNEKLAAEQPLVSVSDALALSNEDKTSNEKILSGLGRPPAGDDSVNWDAVINRHSSGDVNSTNPLLISSTVEFDVSGLTSFGLFSFDWTFETFAAADSVVSWQTSEDGLYDKVVMRDDLTWSDGHPVTAHDVAFSFQVIMTRAVPVPAVRQGTNLLRWVEAYDDHTVVFFHKESLATNVLNVNFPVVPKHVYEKSLPDDPTMTRDPRHVELEDNPIVGGAYEIQSRTRGSEIILERRESYYMHEGKQVRDKPYFKTIRFRIRPDETTALLALKAGDIDEMILNPEQWQTQTSDRDFYDRNTKVYATEWTSFHFVWNLKDPRFSDRRVREAMSYAFDHKELLKALLFDMCEPCTGNFHPTSRWAPQPAPQPYEQDLDKAEDLLDEAGWGDSNDDGIRDKVINGQRVDFEFTVLTNNRQDRIDICNLLRESLDQIGIRCDVKALEFASVIDKLHNKDFQAAFGGWGSGIDPDSSENIYGTNQERNYGSYSNPEVDRLFVEGRKELDLQKRDEIYRKIALILWEDQPYTWLYYRNAFYGFNKSLRGYYFSPRGPYHYGPGFSSIYKPAAQP